MALSLRIKEEAQRIGFGLVGISPLRTPPHEESFAQWLRAEFDGEMAYMRKNEPLRRDPRVLVPWAVSVISVGLNYYKPLPRPQVNAPARGWISRYAWGDDYHDVVRRRLKTLHGTIEELFGAPIRARAFVDSGPVLERDFAGIAGLGWIGKNTQLISPKEGSWFFLGELFVDFELAYDRPIRDRCGRCALCLEACPTGAFAGPYLLDARRCISYLTIELKGWIPRHLRTLLGAHVFGCDICQEVCPYNVKARASPERAFSPRSGLYVPDLLSLLSLTESEFHSRFHGSPILRAKRRGFLRNVAVALGNVGGAESVAGLLAALDDDEPLVRGHAAWALGRIGGYEAMAGLRRRSCNERDDEVRDEIEAAIAAGTQSCGR